MRLPKGKHDLPNRKDVVKKLSASYPGIDFAHDYASFVPDVFSAQLKDEFLKQDTLYINAWDPWSMVGNGNANDASLDGGFGKSTAMAVLAWPFTNQKITYAKMNPLPLADRMKLF